MPAKPVSRIIRACFFLLLVLSTASVQAQEVSESNVLDIWRYPFPPEVKSVRLIDQQFSIAKESEDEDWQDADTLFDNDEDTI
ncbi:MAG TPA: hypothetical protein VK826_14800, partial [Bacteroidia bacterium]|nr:hypothetical protein [Bacteroidia bacterium]